jgi:hypothetical protein
MEWTKGALKNLMQEMQSSEPYKLQDLFKIRDALMVLQGYGLADLELLIEVMKYINQEGQKSS